MHGTKIAGAVKRKMANRLYEKLIHRELIMPCKFFLKPNITGCLSYTTG